MSIPSSLTRVSALTDGVTKTFAVQIQAYQAADFLVLLVNNATGGAQTLVLGADYSMAASSSDTPPKWSLTTLAAAALLAGSSVLTILNPALNHQTVYPNASPIPSPSLQFDTDRLTQMALRLNDQVGRTLRAPDGDLNAWPPLPSASARANMAAVFDGGGLPTVGAPVAQTLVAAQIQNYGTDTGVANAYVVAVSGTFPFGLTTGTLLRYNALNANTGPATLNAGGTGVQPIVGFTGAALVGGEISATGTTWVQWTGAAWQLVGTGTVPSYIRTADEITAGVAAINFNAPPNTLVGYLNGARYQFVTDGVTDNATAIANATAVAAVHGGTILIPAGTSNTSAWPNLGAKQNIVYQGVGSPNSGLARASVIAYTGVAATWISMPSAQGIQFRNLQLIHSNAGFTGTYIVGGNDGVNGDCTFCAVIDCYIGASPGTGCSYINLDKCINFTVDRTTFQFGNPCIRGRAAASYSNVVRIRDSEFFYSLGTPIVWMGQSWTIDGCTFEGVAQIKVVTFTGAVNAGSTSATLAANWANQTGYYNVTFSDGEVRQALLTNGATTCTWVADSRGGLTNTVTANANGVGYLGNALDSGSSATQFAGLNIEGNWFGDATVQGGTWLQLIGSGLTIHGNYMGGGLGAAGTQAMAFSGVTGASIRGNTFDTFTTCVLSYATATNSNIDFTPEANCFLNCAAVIGNGANSRQRAQIVYSAAMAIDASQGPVFDIIATNGVAFSINNPTNVQDGRRISIWISNTSGGALGVVTFGGSFKLAGAWVSPATGNNRSIEFEYRAIAGVWYEVTRSVADTPN